MVVKILVQHPPPTLWLTTIHISSSRGSNSLFGALWVQSAIHIFRQNIYIENKIVDIFKVLHLFVYFVGVYGGWANTYYSACVIHVKVRGQLVSALYFCYVNPGDGTQAVRLGIKHLCPRSHLCSLYCKHFHRHLCRALVFAFF